MFETAVEIFNNNALFGAGVGSYQSNARKYYYSNNSRLSEEVIKWKNPHNEFLLQAATRGVIGVISVVYLFGSFGFFFIGFYSRKLYIKRFSAVSGLLVIFGYVQFGMSISLFEHRDFLLFYILYLNLFFADIDRV
jgi:O-antigen ligase